LGGVWLRLVARCRARDLDRQLASGTDPMLSDELSLRVGQLGAPRSRRRLAAALRRAVDHASGRHPPLLTTKLRCAEIEENEELILALAERLRDGRPVGARGLAMVARLVDDRWGPLYRSGPGGLLPSALAAARKALDGGHLTAAST
jgi:hypothetical protein